MRFCKSSHNIKWIWELLIEIAKYLQDGDKILEESSDLSTALAGYAFYNIIYQRSNNEPNPLSIGTNIYLLGLNIAVML